MKQSLKQWLIRFVIVILVMLDMACALEVDKDESSTVIGIYSHLLSLHMSCLLTDAASEVVKVDSLTGPNSRLQLSKSPSHLPHVSLSWAASLM